MKDFLEVLKLLRDTPIPILLVGGGLVFLFISIGGQFGATIDTDKTRVKEKAAAIVGSILLIFGIALYIVPPILSIMLENNGASNNVGSDSPDQNTLVTEPTVTPTPLSTESRKLPVFRGQKTTTVNAGDHQNMFYVQRTTSLFNDSGEQIGQVNCGERFFNLYKSGNYILAELNFSSISEDVDPQRKNVQSVGWVLEADVVYSTAETNPINCN